MHEMKKQILWLLTVPLHHPDLAYVIPTLAWMAEDLGILLETYHESERNGRLFAKTGSTILGGHHHQQFNYLCAKFDVKLLQLGNCRVFESSIKAFGLETIAQSTDAGRMYSQILDTHPLLKPQGIFLGPSYPISLKKEQINIQPYLFPEILHRRALGFPASGKPPLRNWEHLPVWSAFLTPQEARGYRRATKIDNLRKSDTWTTLVSRLAMRWKKQSRGIVFGDPAAVLSQIAVHCRHKRIALFAPVVKSAPAQTKVSSYTESTSPAAELAGQLAVDLGNRVIHGRQTGDGDIFAWSKKGVCIQIVDPNRPAFPVVSEAPHEWSPAPLEDDVTDTQLAQWAREGRVLTTLLVHSGEVAHNEAMLALIEMAGWNGLKMGIGAHAQRYETCPQLWELIAVSREHGGAAGLIEPLLHSGGLGVLAEWNCPSEILADHCYKALERITAIASAAHTPKGYYAFMDSNLDRLDRIKPRLFKAISSRGLRYIVSSARPGRNRILWQTSNCLAINQTPRVVHGASPFVRTSTADDMETTSGAVGPGWIIGTLDAPVVAFAPYIWRKGNKIVELAETLRNGNRINVLPSTIARYARLLGKKGLLPVPSSPSTIIP